MSAETGQSSTRRPIGYTITRYWCRKCAPESALDSWEPMREGDDHGVPYHCDDCGEPLLPCDHAWAGDWRLAFTPDGQAPRDIDFCTKCDEARYRPSEQRANTGASLATNQKERSS
jgi:hypothetical protein